MRRSIARLVSLPRQSMVATESSRDAQNAHRNSPPRGETVERAGDACHLVGGRLKHNGRFERNSPVLKSFNLVVREIRFLAGSFFCLLLHDIWPISTTALK
jgi:hypothetical protein